MKKDLTQIILNNPIKINGETVTTLTYDVDEIDNGLFLEADARAHDANIQKRTGTAGVNVRETDNSFHLYLGYAAVIAVNREIDFSDMERIKGRDIILLSTIGRNFTSGTLAMTQGTGSVESNSDEQSEDIPNDTTPQ